MGALVAVLSLEQHYCASIGIVIKSVRLCGQRKLYVGMSIVATSNKGIIPFTSVAC